jgi:hypothetical protein
LLKSTNNGVPSLCNFHHVRYHDLKAASMKMTFFCDTASCSVEVNTFHKCLLPPSPGRLWWRKYPPLKRRSTLTRLHDAISHKAVICSSLHPDVTSSFLAPNIKLRTMFSNTLNLCCSFNVTPSFTPTQNKWNYAYVYCNLCAFRYHTGNAWRQHFPVFLVLIS